MCKAPRIASKLSVVDDKGLHKWLTNTETFDFCFVSGVPATPEATEKLCEHICFIRKQSGKFWEFTADLSKGDTAYTTMALGAHTNNTYFVWDMPISLVAPLIDCSGGATLLVDGLYVAALMKELHPNLHDLLSPLYIPSPPAMYPPLRYHPNTKELQSRWNELLTKPDSEYWIQLTPGIRRVCGAYIGIDEYRSKLAVLKEKFDGADDNGQNKAGRPKDSRSIWNSNL
ncbi:hypothetical protein BDR03DRAFT_943571 [Suillus americanus]|nr:hypothetical protein BDR03DRAFT_943571 [Suillus americanus]